MLSRSQAKVFFIGGTTLAMAAFVGLSIHSFGKIPEITNEAAMDPMVVQGKHLFDRSNCMGCHTLLGEGGYYAPELTRVYERRGPAFIRSMLEDPQAMYPDERRMVDYDFTDEEIEAFIAFFKWIGEMDLNGFPPDPILFGVATAGADTMVEQTNRPKVFNQMCIACHALGDQGGDVGPALDGVGDRMTRQEIEEWLEEPSEVRPGTAMPDLPLSEEDIKELGAFLSTLRAEPGPEGAPPPGSPEAETEGPDVPPKEPEEVDAGAPGVDPPHREGPVAPPLDSEEGDR
ncbi:MAG: c-type cytochrome [Myxococcota bacterium]